MVDGLMIVAMTLLFYAALHDVASRTIPNWVSGIILLDGILLQSVAGNLEPSLLFGLGIFVVLGSAWFLGGLGGADVKLWSAATLLLPPSWPAEWKAAVLVIFSGGLTAMTYIVLRRVKSLGWPSAGCPRKLPLWRRSLRSEIWRIRRGGPLPYAVAICAGFFLTLWPMLRYE